MAVCTVSEEAGHGSAVVASALRSCLARTAAPGRVDSDGEEEAVDEAARCGSSALWTHNSLAGADLDLDCAFSADSPKKSSFFSTATSFYSAGVVFWSFGVLLIGFG